jgi:hypothetical protein
MAALCCAAACAADGAAPTFTSAQLRADLKEIQRALHEMPADLARSADVAALERAFRDLEGKLERAAPLDRDEAWRLFAQLNPILADGHLFVGFVDWRGDTRTHLANGGRLFPFEVRVTPGCELSVRGNPRSAMLLPQADARIRKVNGVAAQEICEQLMARAHGDTRVFRADLLSRRFWFFYWKLYGAPETYDLTLESGGTQRFEGSTKLPELLAAEADFDRQFDLELVADNDKARTTTTAILTLRSFAWPDKDQVLAFTQTAFESLRRWNIKTLIIDLRDNGGGNDDQWIEGVMPYIATKRWRTASTYRKRVVTPDPARGEVVGAVVDGEIETWYPPQPDNPLHFGGKVYVAVGPGTYSSAVVMSTVFQDFGFGRVIGPNDSVRANSSGGTRRTTLTNSGLIVVAPRFVLTRPSGAKQPVLLTPDIPYSPEESLVDFSVPSRK